MIREIVRKTSLPIYFVLDTIRHKRWSAQDDGLFSEI